MMSNTLGEYEEMAKAAANMAEGIALQVMEMEPGRERDRCLTLLRVIKRLASDNAELCRRLTERSK